MASSKIKLIECPRDAMQGWKPIIPTTEKVEYINALLNVGFDTIDFGSFVSPKAIPQMADTKEVIKKINRQNNSTKLLAIIANLRGAEEASIHENIDLLGFPFSVSETFQHRNTNAGIDESFERVEDIQNLCVKTGKKLVVYLSMGFGNPYGDPFSPEIVFQWANKLAELDIEIISLADTVGLATQSQVADMSAYLIKQLPKVEIGVHLHAAPDNWKSKLSAAYTNGISRFDGALMGIGGCPMANDDLVGNMDTMNMISYFKQEQVVINLNQEALEKSISLAQKIFN